jgi:o-succinylbenzoate synthase
LSLAASTLTLREGAASSPVGAARARVTARRGLLLTLLDRDGTAGVGEASPLPGFSRETVDDVIAALDGAHRWLAPDALEDPLAALASPRVQSLPGAARFAVETALCDLVGRRRGVALHRVLNAHASGAPVPVNAYVGAALDEGLVTDARAALARGVRTLKVKLSGADDAFDRELAALLALRAALPGPWSLRLDANGAWTVARARERLRALTPLAPEFVEQPVAVGSLHALGRCEVPWAIDESFADARDTDFALREGLRGGCAAAVIKPAIHGLVGGYELGLRASTAGVGAVVTHLFDGPVGLAAACELALALPAPIACGLDLHPGLAAWDPVEIPQRRDAPFVTPAAAPGLGFTVAPYGPPPR